MTWWFSIWMTFWERLVVGRNGCRFGRWLQVWYTGHHFENCWLMLKRPPLEPKHFIVWWVFSFFEFLFDRFQRFRFFWCRFFWYDFWNWPHYWTADCWRHFYTWFYRMHRRTSIPRTFSAGVRSFAFWHLAVLKWTIYWMVCCVSTGWLKKLAYMLFNHHSRFAKFATSLMVDDLIQVGDLWTPRAETSKSGLRAETARHCGGVMSGHHWSDTSTGRMPSEMCSKIAIANMALKQ